MDTTIMRLVAQVALVIWCVATAVALLASRGRMVRVGGRPWALAGLACFGGWMFLAALTIKDTELFPRSSVLWLFALLELGTAGSAWGWLGIHVSRNFRLRRARVADPDGRGAIG